MVVDLLDAVEVRQVGAGQGKLLREKLRRLGIADALEVPDHVVGREVAAIMPLHALSQGKDPALVVGRIDMPLGREARLDVRRPVALRQIPVDQGVVQIPADESKAFKALVWIARRDRQIARGHRYLQDAGCPGRRRGGNQPSSNEAGHCATPREHLEGRTHHRASVVAPGTTRKDIAATQHRRRYISLASSTNLLFLINVCALVSHCGTPRGSNKKRSAGTSSPRYRA